MAENDRAAGKANLQAAGQFSNEPNLGCLQSPLTGSLALDVSLPGCVSGRARLHCRVLTSAALTGRSYDGRHSGQTSGTLASQRLHSPISVHMQSEACAYGKARPHATRVPCAQGHCESSPRRGACGTLSGLFRASADGMASGGQAWLLLSDPQAAKSTPSILSSHSW